MRILRFLRSIPYTSFDLLANTILPHSEIISKNTVLFRKLFSNLQESFATYRGSRSGAAWSTPASRRTSFSSIIAQIKNRIRRLQRSLTDPCGDRPALARRPPRGPPPKPLDCRAAFEIWHPAPLCREGQSLSWAGGGSPLRAGSPDPPAAFAAEENYTKNLSIVINSMAFLEFHNDGKNKSFD